MNKKLKREAKRVLKKTFKKALKIISKPVVITCPPPYTWGL